MAKPMRRVLNNEEELELSMRNCLEATLLRSMTQYGCTWKKLGLFLFDQWRRTRIGYLVEQGDLEAKQRLAEANPSFGCIHETLRWSECNSFDSWSKKETYLMKAVDKFDYTQRVKFLPMLLGGSVRLSLCHCRPSAYHSDPCSHGGNH